MSLEPEDVGTLWRSELDTDERGFWLILRTDAGAYRMRLPTEAGMELDAALEPVREHHAEGEYERAAYDRATPQERAQVLGLEPHPSDGQWADYDAHGLRP